MDSIFHCPNVTERALDDKFDLLVPSYHCHIVADSVSGHSKPASEGQMKTSHFESGIAHGAAISKLKKDIEVECGDIAQDRLSSADRLTNFAKDDGSSYV